jgi:hypothetical protein
MFGGEVTRRDYRFIPLASKQTCSGCSIDILFLRREAPGNLIRSGGDIDNRIKVLFDGLKVPQEDAELPSESPTADEVPFFCLLQDDSLITEVHVITDRLLIPHNPNEERETNVHLVIRVATMGHIVRTGSPIWK